VLPSNAQFQEARMQLHARAPLSPIGRRRVVERVCVEGWSVAAAAEAAGVTERTVIAGWRGFCHEGVAGLVDRPPVARRQPAKTPPERVRLICLLRRLWMTAAEIAEVGHAAVDGLGGAQVRGAGPSARGSSRSSRPTATKARPRASWSTSTSRPWGASRARGQAGREIPPPGARVPHRLLLGQVRSQHGARRRS
jgi:leucine-zipper of insertion element IS481